jgi:predicted O-methyltransferase YrrM
MQQSAINTEVVDGVTFQLRPLVRNATNPAWVCLRKTPKFVERYRALAPELQGCRMVEVGVDQGGGTLFFLKLFKPHRLLAIELAHEPVPKLMSFLAEHDKNKCVNVCWGLDQADAREVPRQVEDMFGGEPLDIVVDDASHLLMQTTTTFELLFPRLRPGGVYVIEDWSSVHLMEARIASEIASSPDRYLAAGQAKLPHFDYEMPMSFLICQLLIASARNPEWISDIRVSKGICEIRRGAADIAPGTPITDYLGGLGRWMLNC